MMDVYSLGNLGDLLMTMYFMTEDLSVKHLPNKEYELVRINNLAYGAKDVESGELFSLVYEIKDRTDMFRHLKQTKLLSEPVRVLDKHIMDADDPFKDSWWLASPYLSSNRSCLSAGKTRPTDMAPIYLEILNYKYDFEKPCWIATDPWRRENVLIW